MLFFPTVSPDVDVLQFIHIFFMWQGDAKVSVLLSVHSALCNRFGFPIAPFELCSDGL
jgi:hypothetical protein